MSIEIKPSHVGKFTAKAKAAGMSVREYAQKVLGKDSHSSPVTKHEALFAKNSEGWSHEHHVRLATSESKKNENWKKII